MKKKIAIVTGGDSGENTISLKSARNIDKYIDKDKFDTYLINISGKDWYYKGAHGDVSVDKNDFGFDLNGTRITFDCVFIAIHGTPGEDGKLQGYFDMLGLPYTSCDRTTSALTFSKYFCNRLVSGSEMVHVATSLVVRRKNLIPIQNIIKTTGLPCFVKPDQAGSSLGVSKVKTEAELMPALLNAFAVDSAALVESFIPGREITCGVIELDETVTALPVTEIISKNEYFDFDAKYDKAKADEITPAQIPAPIYEQCQSVSRELYVFLNCKGIVRFDYILTPDEKLYFLEVNAIPGLTDESIVPQQAAAAGISATQLFTILLEQSMNTQS